MRCALLAFAAALFLAAHARAETPQTLGILVLAPEGFSPGPAEIHAGARRVVERETTLAVAPFDLFTEATRAAAIRACAGDGRCFLAQFEESGVAIDLLLTISVARLDERVLLGLRSIAAGDARELAVHGGELDVDIELDRALEVELGRVLPPEIWGRIAALELLSEPAGALASVAERSCTTPCKLDRLQPGTYDVSMTRAGYQAVRLRADLRRKETARVSARLDPVPEDATLIESPWFWVALAAGVALASTGVAVLATRGGDTPDTVCIANPGDCR